MINFYYFPADSQAIKGILFGISLGFLCQFPGGITFLNYAVIIFEKSGASYINPYESSILLAVAQIIGGLVSTKLADSLGRKLLMIVAFLSSAVGLFINALYLYLNQNGYELTSLSWIPVATISFNLFVSSAGIYSIMAVCFVEYLPTKVWSIFILPFIDLA